MIASHTGSLHATVGGLSDRPLHSKYSKSMGFKDPKFSITSSIDILDLQITQRQIDQNPI